MFKDDYKNNNFKTLLKLKIFHSYPVIRGNWKLLNKTKVGKIHTL